MANPGAADQFVATVQAVRLLGWHVGEVIPMGIYTNAQISADTFGTAKAKPRRRLELRLTGIVVFNNGVVRDDVDRLPAFVLFNPGPHAAGQHREALRAVRSEAPRRCPRGPSGRAGNSHRSPGQNHLQLSRHFGGRGPVRFRAGESPAAGLASLQRIAQAAMKTMAALPDKAAAGENLQVLPVQYPAEIENYRTIGAMPVLLAGGLAAGAVIALGLTITASVRRRRHELALLKTLGFTQRQVAACVAWQSTVSAVLGVIAGIPLGIVVGRWLWILFAREIYAVPRPTVPVLPLVLVGLGALVLANVVAAIPGRYAARTPTALIFRAE